MGTILMKTFAREATRWGKALAARMVAVAASLMIAGSAAATSVIAMNLAQVSETAESAFVIQITDVETTRGPKGAYDLISGTITDPIFGNVTTSQTLSWKQFRPGIAMPLEGVPSFTPGKEYVVFLSGKGRGTDFQLPVGLAQGAFDVLRNKATGAAMVRNGFGNATLASGLNVSAVAEDMVSQNPRTRALNSTARIGEQMRLKEQLRPRPSGNSLETLKSAAQFFHDQKKRGRLASREYVTSSPLRLMH